MMCYVWGACGLALGVVMATICMIVAAALDDRDRRDVE